VNTVLQECVALVANQPLFHNIEVVKRFGEDLPLVPMDPSQMQQVFMNLIIKRGRGDAHGGPPDADDPPGPSGRFVEFEFRGHGLRHQGGGPGADLRPLLHDQGGPPRDRAGVGDQLRHRQGAPGDHHGRQRGRQGHHVRGAPADVARGGGVGVEKPSRI